MKKTVTMNLGGRVFHVDEDAYALLEEYLENLSLHFDENNQTKYQTIEEFEAYFSDLLLRHLSGDKVVVNITLIREIIEKINSQEFNSADAELGSDHSGYTEHSRQHMGSDMGGANSNKRRFYRDMDHAALCGVCSGLAAYTGWNVSAIRVFTVLLTLVATSLFWLIILTYLAIWMIVPPAITVSQKLEMYGEPITVENIGRLVSDVDDVLRNKKNAPFLTAFGCLLKGLFVLLGIGLILIVVFGLFGVMMNISVENYMIDVPSRWLSIPSWMVISATISVFIVVLVPVFAILLSHHGNGKLLGIKSFALGVWITAVVFLAVIFVLITRELGLNIFLYHR